MMLDDQGLEQRAAEYQQGHARYAAAVAQGAPWLAASPLRVEHHFECLRDWSLFHSQPEVEAWFEAERARCAMEVTDIPLREVRGWTVDPSTGDIAHDSGKFFVVHGVRVSLAARREVASAGWDQPIVREVTGDGGVLGLLRQRFRGVPHYLLEAKAEPGNYQRLQLSPTLQATFSNLRQAHQGRRPHFAELFEDPPPEATVHYRAWLSEDGGRLHKKRNQAMLVEVPEATTVPTPAGFVWVSMYQIKALLHRDAWVNPHVRGIIAHL
jgi:oxidase EvaA